MAESVPRNEYPAQNGNQSENDPPVRAGSNIDYHIADVLPNNLPEGPTVKQRSGERVQREIIDDTTVGKLQTLIS